MKLLKTNKFQWVQHMNKEERTRLFTTSYSKIISKYNDTKNKIPINNLIEIKFEDLYQTPNEHIQHIYSKFIFKHVISCKNSKRDLEGLVNKKNIRP